MPAQPDCIQNDPLLAAGNQCYAVGEYCQALAAYREQLPSHPQAYLVHFAIANGLVQLRRHEEAIGSYFIALQAQPELLPACVALADTFYERRMLEPAVYWYQRARRLGWDALESNLRLGFALVDLQRVDEAAAMFVQWRQLEPDNPFAQHLSQALLTPDQVTAAPHDYVCALFDGYAEHFDRSLSGLGYQGPALLEQALLEIDPAPSWRLLDVGCGTGWVAQQLQPHTEYLAGVDLSAEMIRQARLRGVYDELVCSDLVAYLEQGEDLFDVITASDTLTYLGDLTAFCTAAPRRLVAGGLLALNVEALTDEQSPRGYRLQPTGRFGHTRAYVERCLEQVGMEVVSVKQNVLRKQADQDVACWVVVGRSI